MQDTIVIGGDLKLSEHLEGDCSLSLQADGDAGIFMPLYPAAYTGATEVTPSSSTQVLNTAGWFMGNDITIKPIPSNYGLITWNGSTLTVS